MVERQIREAAERGEFDGLAGRGRPIDDLDAVYDPGWWAKRYVRREKARDRADELRRAIRGELPHLRVSSDQTAAEERVGELNRMVAAVNDHLPPEDRLQTIRL